MDDIIAKFTDEHSEVSRSASHSDEETESTLEPPDPLCNAASAGGSLRRQPLFRISSSELKARTDQYGCGVECGLRRGELGALALRFASRSLSCKLSVLVSGFSHPVHTSVSQCSCSCSGD